MPIGVAAFALPTGAPPVRVYYPAVQTVSKHRRATVFRFGVRRVVMSYIALFGGIFVPSLKHGGGLFQLVSLCLWPLLASVDLIVSTLRLWLRVPLLARDEPPLRPSADGLYPVLIFSHGLTGIGEEHASLFAAHAQRGFIVVAPTHCDGSAALSKAGTADVYYTHPDMKNYDRNFRLEQVQRRAEEIHALRRFVFGEGRQAAGLLGDICRATDPERVVLGGFSYGAATASHVAAASADAEYRGIVLLDGWFNIDLRWVKSAASDEQIAFPPLAHAKGLGPPALFVGSQSFAKMDGMGQRARELQSRCRGGAEVHNLPGTSHLNFIDLVLWLPAFLHPLLRKAKLFGTVDAHRTLETINGVAVAFAERVTK
jgi:pimeloyl-ACP methyl ester carboxylesterase